MTPKRQQLKAVRRVCALQKTKPYRQETFGKCSPSPLKPIAGTLGFPGSAGRKQECPFLMGIPASHPTSLCKTRIWKQRREQAAHGAKQQAKLEEGLDPNLVISGMTQGSEEFLTSQNEICLPAIKGTFKAGLTHSIPCQGGEDFI